MRIYILQQTITKCRIKLLKSTHSKAKNLNKLPHYIIQVTDDSSQYECTWQKLEILLKSSGLQKLQALTIASICSIKRVFTAKSRKNFSFQSTLFKTIIQDYNKTSLTVNWSIKPILTDFVIKMKITALHSMFKVRRNWQVLLTSRDQKHHNLNQFHSDSHMRTTINNIK